MKLLQLHRSGFSRFELTGHELKVTSLYVADWNKGSVALEDILVDDIYRIKIVDRSLAIWIFIYGAFLWEFSRDAFFSKGVNWIGTSVFGLLLLHAIITLLFFPSRKICIPVKGGRMIRMFERLPNRKRVDAFIYELEGKVKLIAKPEVRFDKVKKKY